MSIAAANLPNGRKYYVDNNGKPLSGGSVTFFVVGTTDLAVVYSDDMQTTLAQNPITLDASGMCSIFGVGQFREVVMDQSGNTLSDQTVVAGTPVLVTDAMRPVIEAATPADAEAILKGTTPQVINSLDIEGDQSLNVSPTANAPATQASLNVQGTSTFPDDREFLVNLGFTSPVGHSGTAGNDKVTLYAGMEAQAGTSNCWSLNTVLGQEPNSGDYTAQGYELDFNNGNVDRGNSGNLDTDFSGPTSVGMTISGAGSKTSTLGMGVLSVAATPIWNRGFATIGTLPICGYQEWSHTPVGMQFDGDYAVAAINMTSLYGNAGAVTSTGLFLKNNQSVTWQSADTSQVIADVVDSNNNRVVGLSSGTPGQLILCGNTIPQTPGASLGSSSNRWGEFFSTAIRMANASVLTWDANPSASTPPGQQVIDFVNNNNDRVVGSGAQTVYSGSQLAPQFAGMNLGSPANYWGVIYNNGGIQTPSDLRLKQDVMPLGSVLDQMGKIQPISFQFRADQTRHYGFDAAEVEAEFDQLVERHGEDGIRHLKQTDLLAVLWKAVNELVEDMRRLETKLADHWCDQCGCRHN